MLIKTNIDPNAYKEGDNPIFGNINADHIECRNAEADGQIRLSQTADVWVDLKCSGSGHLELRTINDTLGIGNLISWDNSYPGQKTFRFWNPKDQSDANVRQQMIVGTHSGAGGIPGNSGDPFLNFSINGVMEYSLGIDNSDDDKFKLRSGVGTSPSVGTELLVITSAGNFDFKSGNITTTGAITGGSLIGTGLDVGAGNITLTGLIRTLSTDRGILSTGTTDGYTIPSGAGIRMMWIPSKAAFRVGEIGASYADYWDAANIGENSFATGKNVQAKSSNTVAIGNIVSVEGNESIGIGKLMTVSGWDSICISGGVGTKTITGSNSLVIAATGDMSEIVASGLSGSVIIGSAKGSLNGIAKMEATEDGALIFGHCGGQYGSPATITSSGYGSIVIGAAMANEITQATAESAIVIGRNIQATQVCAIAVGNDFINNVASTFQVGYGQADFEVKANRVNIPNTSQFKLPVKNTTGDPASPEEGDTYVNTFDNKIRTYADGAWRDLATW